MAEYVTELSESDIMAWGADIRERIVRCRDCRYYDEIIHACEHPCITPLRGDCPENWIFSCFDNDFCCWGKRKVVDA